ncbi:MAG: hypothetical protein HYY90_01040 [Candidatus Omnitrophica bacterium]|nr:hypothetical protein [Candidatus Omnitrophota bacterium]MBI3021881.1 hypothetical protein [Candidatus Omnitrophota bacterium]MBI3082943.1 hypothetical protein [Candidatus Omnitrophota bacterium]
MAEFCGPRRPGRWAWRSIPYAVGILNLLLFHVVFRIERGTFFGGDSGQYMAIAEALRSGALWNTAENGKPLGYPLILALAGSLPGDTVVNALLFNWLFYLTTILAIGHIGRLLTGSSMVGWSAQTLFAVIPNTAAWANLVYSDTMAMGLFVSSFWVFLRIIHVPAEALVRWNLMGLGLLLGLLGITRTEYLVLLPLVTLLLCGLHLSRGVFIRRAVNSALLLWLCSLPLLLLQPTVSGWRGLASLLPPNQSGPLQLWAGRFDLDFSQLRIWKLIDLVHLTSHRPSMLDIADVQRQLDALKYTQRGEDPIDDQVLRLAVHDLQILHTLVTARGLAPLDAYRILAWQTLTQNPWRFVARAIRRFALYVTAAEREWSPAHPAYWVYTTLLRPLSTLGYLFWVMLVMVNRGAARWKMAATGLWMAFPILVHSWFMFEQRWAYPSVPLLCTVWAMAGQTLWGWYVHRTADTRSVVLVCGR